MAGTRAVGSNLKALGWVITAVLAVGILPSFTALSAPWYEALGVSGQLVGPINPLKLALPFLLLFLILNRKRLFEFLPIRIWLILIMGYGIGTLTVFYGLSQCEWRTQLLRDWVLHLAAAGWGLAFFMLKRPQQNLVLVAWLVWVVLACVIDWIFPDFQNFLYAQIFDPQTRTWDQLEVGDVLTGVFGRQTLAKFLAWLPWFLPLLFTPSSRFPQKHFHFMAGMAAVLVFAGVVLATSQRGPFLSVLASSAICLALYARREGLRKSTLALMMTGFIVAVSSLTILFVPQQILESRVRSLIGLTPQGRLGQQADSNTQFRRNMISFSLDVIRENPMGKACIGNWDFWNRGTMAAHAHHLFLQEYRSRGWFWGTFHLLLWLAAGWFLYRSLAHDWATIFWFGGFLSIVFTGQFDYPWMALSQSLVIWVFLWKGLSSGSEKSYVQT